MPVVSNKVVELADTPAKADDYIKVNGLRLVRCGGDLDCCVASSIWFERPAAAGQTLLF